MSYELSYEEIQKARKYLKEAENIFRKQNLVLASIINHAHYTIVNILENYTDNKSLSKTQANPKDLSANKD